MITDDDIFSARYYRNNSTPIDKEIGRASSKLRRRLWVRHHLKSAEEVRAYIKETTKLFGDYASVPADNKKRYAQIMHELLFRVEVGQAWNALIEIAAARALFLGADRKAALSIMGKRAQYAPEYPDNLQLALHLLISGMNTEIHLSQQAGSVDKNLEKPFQAKGGEAAAARFEEAKEFAVTLAKDRWDEDEGVRVGTLAEEIGKIISADPERLGLSKAPTKDTIKKWIIDIAPSEARKSGRPPKR